MRRIVPLQMVAIYPKTTHPRDICCNMKIVRSSHKRSEKPTLSSLPPGPDARQTSLCNRKRGRSLPHGVLFPTRGLRGLALLFAVGHPVANITRIACLSVWVCVASFTSEDQDSGSTARMLLQEFLSRRHWNDLVIGLSLYSNVLQLTSSN